MISVILFALIRVIRGRNGLLIDIARWRYRRPQERVLRVLLVERLNWDRAADLDGFLFLRLNGNGFPNRFDRNRFPNLRSGFWCLRAGSASICGIARRLHFAGDAYLVRVLILRCLDWFLRCWLEFRLWLERIVRVLVSYKSRIPNFDWRDLAEVHRERSAGQ